MSDKFDWEKTDLDILRQMRENDPDESPMDTCDICDRQFPPQEMVNGFCFDCMAKMDEQDERDLTSDWNDYDFPLDAWEPDDLEEYNRNEADDYRGELDGYWEDGRDDDY